MAKTVYLAPLEGLADAPMREVLCRHGHYDRCYSEFLRVTDLVMPEKTMIREVPEFNTGCKTLDGTPIGIQFLGDNKDTISKSALKAYNLGARFIDMNFGCPSRFVHHGGAMLLKEPELMHSIVSELRQTLPDDCSLSVKVRLGFSDQSEAPEIIRSIAIDGVSEITVHCRTRKGLYRDDALNWSALKDLHEIAGRVKLIANGNINSYEDSLLCQQQTLCDSFMCGRGAFSVPNLGAVIKDKAKPYSLSQILKTDIEVIETFSKTDRTQKVVMDRAKQFLGYARAHRIELKPFFLVFCRCQNIKEGLELLEEKIKSEEQNEAWNN